MKLRADGFPRRNDITLNTPAELAIRQAITEVEKVGADVRLTDIVRLLGEAHAKLADYNDDQPSVSQLGTPISQLSGRPGHPGFDAYSEIASSWGHD